MNSDWHFQINFFLENCKNYNIEWKKTQLLELWKNIVCMSKQDSNVPSRPNEQNKMLDNDWYAYIERTIWINLKNFVFYAWVIKVLRLQRTFFSFHTKLDRSISTGFRRIIKYSKSWKPKIQVFCLWKIHPSTCLKYFSVHR